MTLELGDVEETALIPVAIKASESMRKNARVVDKTAVEITQHLGLDFGKFDRFMSHEGVIARTIMLDKMVLDFIKAHENAAIVNLGAGFDDRFSRVDDGKVLWFDVDLPDSIAARRKVFREKKRVKMIGASVLEEAWCAEVKEADGRDMLFIAEGLFMYLSMAEISLLLNVLTSNFPHGTLFAEQNSPLFVKNQKYHDTVKNTNAVFKSGTKSARELCDLCGALKFVDEHSFNEEMRKYSVRAKLFATFFPRMNDRWATFEW